MISVANTKTACFINKYDVLQQKSVCSSDLEQFVTEARLGLELIKSPKMKLHSYTLQVFWRKKKKKSHFNYQSIELRYRCIEIQNGNSSSTVLFVLVRVLLCFSKCFSSV